MTWLSVFWVWLGSSFSAAGDRLHQALVRPAKKVTALLQLFFCVSRPHLLTPHVSASCCLIWYARAEWVFRGLLDQRKEVRRNGRDEFSALRPRERELARQKLTTTAAESSVPVPGQTADPVDDLLLGKIIQLCIEREYAISARDFKNHVKHASAIPALAWIPTVGEFATHRGGEPLAKLSLWEKDPGLALLNQSGKAKAALALLLKWETTSNIVPFRFKK